jgi:two-component system, NtrC family, response regulator
MSNILIIDDDDLMTAVLQQMVVNMGHKAACASTLREGLKKASSQALDVVFLDVNMPDGNGLDVLHRIQGPPSYPEVIIFTGLGDPEGAELAIKYGAWDYIEKGISLNGITRPLERALEYRREKIDNKEKCKIPLKRDGIVGSSQMIETCLDLVSQAAASDSNVLITGETGTGKELFARAIHLNSWRAAGNFVVVDCAALPETLVESILFGHEKGTFTGAERAQQGLISQANEGTFFLDEVGELPLMVQKAFLRVLQEHRFRPLGGKQETESNFRLLSATNQDLDLMVKNGQFREDLLFRLRTFIINLPPLRTRPEDIAELARYHLKKLCDRYNLAQKGFSPEFMDALASHSWPGNVRELVNTLERTLMTGRHEQTLFTKHLPTDIRIKIARASVNHERPTADPHFPPCSFSKFHEFREEAYGQAEKQYLGDLVSFTGGDIQEACRISGLSRSRLYSLLKKHGVKPTKPELLTH